MCVTGLAVPMSEWRGISADFSGCEIRVAAALSGDKQLYEAEVGTRCHACNEDPCGCGKDHLGLHWKTAHTAKGFDATKEDRYMAKRGTFTRLFGGGASTAADQVGCEVSQMEELFEALNEVAPVYTEWDAWLRDCFNQGSMIYRDYATGVNYQLPVEGSRRLVYKCYSGRFVYVTRGPHAAGNGAIQGTARELLVDGLLRWNKTRWGKYPVLPVHDQILARVHAEEAEAASEVLRMCMETSVLSCPQFECFISVDVDSPFTSWPDSS
jgi:DNA polymerase I-like protein with 3'-5' exonuclease and polymerase domains